MSNDGLSIRDQLLALMGRQGNVKRPSEAAPRTQPAGNERKTARPSIEAQASDSWKQGVRPLVPRHNTAAARPYKRPDIKKPHAPVKRVTVQKAHPLAAKAATTAKPIGPASGGSVVEGALGVGSVPVVALSSAKHFKEPDAWVDEGCGLQPPGANESGTVLHARIGLDFGTAYSKLAIRAAGKVFLLDWQGIHQGDSPYLLGGELSELPDRATRVGRAAASSQVYTNLKLPFLGVERTVERDDLVRAALFLAWTVRYARAWLYHHERSVVIGHKLVWEMNIGVPTGSWSNHEELKAQYQILGLAAWHLSQSREPLSLPRAREVVRDMKAADSGWGLDYLGVVPEFAAQIAGYMRSPHRAEGLYLSVDVGAGTLDAACFYILHDRESDTYTLPVYASNVVPLGTHYLMQVRRSATGRTDPDWLSVAKVPDVRALAKQWSCSPDAISLADNKFLTLAASAINAVLRKTRHTGNRTAKEWTTFLPAFLTGGGSGIDVYRQATNEAFKLGGWRTHVRALPRSADIESRFEISDDTYGRMSVAYGLTFPADEVGRLVPPTAIPRDTPGPVKEQSSHEDVYTKR